MFSYCCVLNERVLGQENKLECSLYLESSKWFTCQSYHTKFVSYLTDCSTLGCCHSISVVYTVITLPILFRGLYMLPPAEDVPLRSDRSSDPSRSSVPHKYKYFMK